VKTPGIRLRLVARILALDAEFETLYAESLRQLVSARAAALADPADDHSGRRELDALVQTFVAQLAAFIDTHADRIAQPGISTTELSVTHGGGRGALASGARAATSPSRCLIAG